MAMTASQCCCGCSLRTGTLIIAHFMLVCSILTLLSLAGTWESIYTAADHESNTMVEFKRQPDETSQTKEVADTALIGVILGGVVPTILNALLLVGVHKEKRNLVVLWIMAYSVICVLSVLYLVSSFFLPILDPITQIALGFNTVLYLYFLHVVWSFHNSNEAGYNRQPNAADKYDTEYCNIQRMPLENPI